MRGRVANNIPHAEHVWVGAKARKWLDGRGVTKYEWRWDQPDDVMDACDRMMWNNTLGRHHVTDWNCSYAFSFLCMRN